MKEQNKKLSRQVFEDVLTEGRLDLLDKLVARDYVGQTPLMTLHGPDGARQFFNVMRTAFPDCQFIVEDQIAEGDRVATRWTGKGTHNGEFMGVPPTGEQVELNGIAIFRIADGKFVEGWNNIDLLSVMKQVGNMVPSN